MKILIEVDGPFIPDMAPTARGLFAGSSFTNTTEDCLQAMCLFGRCHVSQLDNPHACWEQVTDLHRRSFGYGPNEILLLQPAIYPFLVFFPVSVSSTEFHGIQGIVMGGFPHKRGRGLLKIILRIHHTLDCEELEPLEATNSTSPSV